MCHPTSWCTVKHTAPPSTTWMACTWRNRRSSQQRRGLPSSRVSDSVSSPPKPTRSVTRTDAGGSSNLSRGRRYSLARDIYSCGYLHGSLRIGLLAHSPLLKGWAPQHIVWTLHRAVCVRYITFFTCHYCESTLPTGYSRHPLRSSWRTKRSLNWNVSWSIGLYEGNVSFW